MILTFTISSYSIDLLTLCVPYIHVFMFFELVIVFQYAILFTCLFGSFKLKTIMVSLDLLLSTYMYTNLSSNLLSCAFYFTTDSRCKNGFYLS